MITGMENSPLYDLYLEPRLGYLYARVRAATLDSQSALDYFTDLLRRASSLRWKKVLLHREIANTLSDEDLEFVMDTLAAMGHDIRVAILNEDLSQKPSMQLAETLARFAGLQQRHFTRKDHAERWLVGTWE
jgi:hypothetical protein